MATKRVIAHFMHETERDAAKPLLNNIIETESYLIGNVEEANIPNLQQKGIIVHSLETPSMVETPGGDAEPIPGVTRRSFNSRALRAEPASEAPETIDITGPNYYVVSVDGPLIQDWRNQLSQNGFKPQEYLPRFSYTGRLAPSEAKAVKNLPFVRSVRLYNQQDTGPVALVTRSAPMPPSVSPSTGQRRMLTYDLQLHLDQDIQNVVPWLEARNIAIAGTGSKKIRIYLLEGDARADEISRLPAIKVMEEHVPPKLHNDESRAQMNIDIDVGGNPGSYITQTGEGQIVGIADTGLDQSHPDFAGKLVGIVALGRTGDSTDPIGHGTHVAGSVLGNGSASSKRIRGTAPDAKLFFQSLLDSSGGLGGLPVDLADLFEEAYQAGARIHNNSWGAATQSFYTVNSVEVDGFLNKRRDMLVVISAGNEGSAAKRKNSKKGFVDWLSIGSPGSSKNALTVGASRSPRTTGGYSNMLYGSAWPEDFPDGPIGEQKISGDTECMAAFSSRGPCDDKRIKPDVVAPGTDILSTKSSTAPLGHFWGPYPQNNKYAYMGGTSMAAPLVAGCAALVREYYVKEKKHNPSSALLKATIINGTRWLKGSDSQADFADMPNFHQGFGRVDMSTTIPNQKLAKFKLEFIDSMNDPSHQFGRTGQRFRFLVKISGGSSLRICLTWNDPAGRALQNNLDLFVQSIQTNQKWMGNEMLPLSLHIPDPDNNVEVVRLENPPAGEYLIQVTATNLLQMPQDFALVVSGDLETELEER